MRLRNTQVENIASVGYKVDVKAFHAEHEGESEIHDLFTWRTRLEDNSKITQHRPLSCLQVGKFSEWRRKNHKEEEIIIHSTRLPIDTTCYNTNEQGIFYQNQLVSLLTHG